MSNSVSTNRIVWVDCEMTGLDITSDALIEVSVVVTDYELKPLGEGIDVLIKPPQNTLDNMGDFVRNMHTKSGLIDELDNGMSLEEAQKIVLDYIKQYVPEQKKASLGGNSVGTDKEFLHRDMPDVIDYLHYRIIDVSTIKELSRHWYPRAYFAQPIKNGGHRALADILESIDELRYFRAAVFKDQPGLSTDESRAIATSVMETSVKNSHLKNQEETK